MNNKKLKLFFSVILSIITLLSVCVINVSAVSVKLSKSSIILTKGYAYTLKLNNYDGDVKWTTSNSKVATVSVAGKVTAKSSGTCYIYATADNQKYKCKVTVRPCSLTVSKTGVSVEKGQTTTITVTTKNSKDIFVTTCNKDVVDSKILKWDGNKATIQFTGKEAGSSSVTIYFKKYEYIYKNVLVVVKDGDSEHTVDDGDYSDEVLEVLKIVNEERVKAGLEKLTLDKELSRLADIRCGEAAKKFEHVRPDNRSWSTVFDDENYSYNSARENLAKGQKSAEEVMTDWMNSSGHKANILSDNVCKIGIAYDSNTHVWVQLFTN